MHFDSLPLAILATAAVAAPAPKPQVPAAAPVCDSWTTYSKYEVSSVSKIHYGKAALASGSRCTSSDTQPCGEGTTYSYTQGVIETVSVTGGLLLGKILMASASAGYSTAWTESETTGTTTTVNCPEGHITCAAQVKPGMRTVKGKKVWYYRNKIACGDDPTDEEDFEVEVPAIVEDAPKNQQAVMNFEACKISAPDDVDTDIPDCPDE